MYVDSHCHLTNDNYDNLESLINDISPNLVIINGVNNDTNIDVINIVNNNSNVYGALGIHPEEIDSYKESDLDYIEKNLINPKIVAIGEVGLDYYWRKDNKEAQKQLFKKQIELAIKYNKALIIHSRDAIEDTYDILSDYYQNNKDLKVILHCYSSSKEMAQRFMKMNVMFGIGGVVTFKNEKKMKEVVKTLDLNKILLETDSPYLSPEPLRGKKNSPKNIPIIASKIAEIKGISAEKVLEITTQNAVDQFDLEL